jgi:DNA-binding NarL/FixJ family response regulator
VCAWLFEGDVDMDHSLRRRVGVGELTAFEHRILTLRTTGLSRAQIARDLGRSPQTISNSLTVAKEKLGARTLMEAVRLWLSEGERTS